jgi:hypothetical protein
MYKADVRLPVKIDEDQMWPGFISMNQWMVYYFGCP